MRLVVAAALVGVLALVPPMASTPALAFTAAPAASRPAIATYYGDPGTGRASRTSSPYISAVGSVLDRQSAYLGTACARPHAAIVLDVDDTMLSTYDMYVGAMDYRLDRSLKNAWVHHEKFPAVAGMVRFVRSAQSSGCRVLVISGRSGTQNARTIANLTKVGYPALTYFAQPVTTAPGYLGCGLHCTSERFKTLTRAHLERVGIRIVANIGDQSSDLAGGHAARGIRLPNRMYTIP